MIDALRSFIGDNVPTNYRIVILEHDKEIENDLFQGDALFVLVKEFIPSIAGRYEVLFSIYLKNSILDSNLSNHFLTFAKLSSKNSEVKTGRKSDNYGHLTYMATYQAIIDLKSYINSYKIKTVSYEFERN